MADKTKFVVKIYSDPNCQGAKIIDCISIGDVEDAIWSFLEAQGDQDFGKITIEPICHYM